MVRPGSSPADPECCDRPRPGARARPCRPIAVASAYRLRPIAEVQVFRVRPIRAAQAWGHRPIRAVRIDHHQPGRNPSAAPTLAASLCRVRPMPEAGACHCRPIRAVADLLVDIVDNAIPAAGRRRGIALSARCEPGRCRYARVVLICCVDHANLAADQQDRGYGCGQPVNI